MNCGEARKIRYVSRQLELLSGERVEAKRHVSECPGCMDFFRQEKEFGALLRESLKKEEVPAGLKQRILLTGAEKKSSFGRIYKAVALAASVLIIIGIGVLFMRGTDGIGLAGKLVEDHIKFLPAPGAQVVSSSREEIRAWFMGKLDFPVAPPEIHAALKGGRLCRLDKKRLALLFYEHNGTQLSLFITDEMGPEKIKIGKEVGIGARRARIIEDRGYNLLMWQERGLTYSLVSELSIEELTKLI